MSRIFVTGDTHRDIDMGKLYEGEFAAREDLTKDDYLIVLGDFGVVWFDDERDIPLRNAYSEFPWTTLFIDGNHENHRALSKYPEEEWNGGKIHRITDSIIHLMRGQVFDIQGCHIFTMGGATSIDRFDRIEGVSWWPEEVPCQEEMDEAIKNLEAHNFSVDYILTHDCPENLYNNGNSITDPVRRFLHNIDHVLPLQYQQWYFGHHHIDKQIDDKHTAVFDKIIKLR